MSPEIFWIPGPWRGRLAIVTRPRGGDWLADEVRGWRQAGIAMMVSLLESEEIVQLDLLDESKLAEANGIQFTSFPIPDRGVPASLPESLSLIARVSHALEKGENVALHCRQGIGRSGLVAAGILTSSGVGSNEAIRIVSSARGIAIPETNDQRVWLERLPSKLPVVTRS